MLDLTQVRIQPLEIAAKLGVELASRFASLFNNRIFHINLPSVPEEYR